jgi:hypothetical protein
MREGAMRYRKGSITLSSRWDYPLLRQIRQSGFITHNQLFEFLKLDYCISSRNAFNNRVLRLVNGGLLVRREGPLANREAVYAVSRTGELELAGTIDEVVHSCPKDGTRDMSRLLHHSIELNEIHLALKRTQALVYWMPEIQVRSRNDLTPYGYWKYYDAVVVVRLAGQDCKFALEYERTPKAARHYAAIRQRIEQEPSIPHFLYIVPNYDFMWFMVGKLSQCTRSAYVGLFRDFLDQTLALPVRRSGSPATVTFSSVLAQGKQGQRPGSLFPGFAV